MLAAQHFSNHNFAFSFNFNLIATKAGRNAPKHTSMPISTIFSVDMIARWKDSTITDDWLKSCFTIDDDVRLGSVNEAPELFFLSTHIQKVYGYNSRVGGMGLDWLYVLRW